MPDTTTEVQAAEAQAPVVNLNIPGTRRVSKSGKVWTVSRPRAERLAKRAPLSLTFGVEIECAVPRATTPASVQTAPLRAFGWEVKGDGSIRPPDGHYGLETVSPILRGEEGITSVRRVCDALRIMQAKVNTSTGLHVHWGVDTDGNDGFSQAKRFLLIYARFEHLFDLMMPRSRRGNANAFCVSLMCSPMLATGADSMSVGGENGDRRRDAYKTFRRAVLRARDWNALSRLFGTRYVKVNVAAHARHGTVEVRHHSGTVSAEKIIGWVRLLDLLWRLAATCQPPVVTARPFNNVADRKLLHQYLGNDPAVWKFYCDRVKAVGTDAEEQASPVGTPSHVRTARAAAVRAEWRNANAVRP